MPRSEQQAELNDLDAQDQTVHVILGNASEPELRRFLSDSIQTVASTDVGVECLRAAISLLGPPTRALGECASTLYAHQGDLDEDEWAKKNQDYLRQLSAGAVAVVIVEVTPQTALGYHSADVWNERSMNDSSVGGGHSGGSRRRSTHLWSERWLVSGAQG